MYTVINSGQKFSLVDPDPSMMHPEVIAHALAYQCRFGGQIRKFYSVAQHSLLTMLLVPEEDRFTALMHDATEAFCADMPKPIKDMLPDYRAIEDRIWGALCSRYDLPLELPETVHIADKQAVVIEARNLLAGDDHENWYPDMYIPEMTLHTMPPEDAKGYFLGCFYELGGK